MALERHFEFEYDYFLESAKRYEEQFPWKRPWSVTRREPVFKLPDHSGFWRLAVIREKTDLLEEAIAVCQQATAIGWPGDWDLRVERVKRRLGKVKKSTSSARQSRQ